MPASDARDWMAIRAWASSLVTMRQLDPREAKRIG